MNARNYQKELEKELLKVEQSKSEGGEAPRLFLHSCCAPCSSYVLQYLRRYFQITVFYYNPNISGQGESRKRVEDQKRVMEIYKKEGSGAEEGYFISVVEGDYEPDVFFAVAKAYHDCPEGGERCFLCYELRLKKTAERAAAAGFDYFCTTLSISPLKNAAKLNEIGERLAAETGVRWLSSDFKKKEGYKQSIALSKEYGLYRQDYCGCVYSKR